MPKKNYLLFPVFILFNLFFFNVSSGMSAMNAATTSNPDAIEAAILPSVKHALSFGDSAYTDHLSILSCDLYNSFNFRKENTLNYEVFQLAYKGYLVMIQEGMISNNRYMTILDFTLSSNQRRLWLLDMQEHRVVLNELVSHGRNSGEEYACSFSNRPESFKSSLGFYVTGTPYMGKNDYSLKLHGAEEGFNDNALERGIVMHGADYVGNRFIHAHKRLGRSQGCPAVSPKINRWLIDEIQGGSCLFIYYPDKNYLKNSEILNTDFQNRDYFQSPGLALNLP